MRIILLKGASAYGVTRRCIDEVARAVARRGFEPVVVDLVDEPDPTGALAAQAAEPAALVFSFAIGGEFRDGTGRTLGQLVGAPHVIQHIDHPLAATTLLDQTAPDTALLFVDPSHAEAVRSIYGPDRFAFLGFSPHGALGEPVLPGLDPDDFAARRPIPVLFPATFYRPGDPAWAALPPGVQSVFEGAVEIALGQEWISALDALDQALQHFGVDPVDRDFAEFRRLAWLVHDHVRARRRFELLKAAARAELPLTVYGKGYDNQLLRFNNITWRGEADIDEVLALMARSRIVLGANANLGAGSHERPLSAMMAGAAAATDDSRFYAQAFGAGQALTTFRWARLDDGVQAIVRLTEDIEIAFAQASRGQAVVAAGHRWDDRINSILHAAAQARRSCVNHTA